MEHIKIEIKGKIYKYSELTADYGYCFYDVDAEEKHYMTSISTPIVDVELLKKKYVVIFGNSDYLNEELQKAVQDDK